MNVPSPYSAPRLHTIELGPISDQFVRKMAVLNKESIENVINTLIEAGMVSFMDFIEKNNPELYKQLSELSQ